MRTREEQIALLEHLLDIARKRKEVGETEWLEFNLKSASNLNGNLNCSKELEHYAS